MNDEFFADVWMLFKEYFDKKNVELAAEKYVDVLIDYGVDDTRLAELLGADKHLDTAIQYYLEMDTDEDEEWDD
jgi:hypothetical protein